MIWQRLRTKSAHFNIKMTSHLLMIGSWSWKTNSNFISNNWNPSRVSTRNSWRRMEALRGRSEIKTIGRKPYCRKLRDLSNSGKKKIAAKQEAPRQTKSMSLNPEPYLKMHMEVSANCQSGRISPHWKTLSARENQTEKSNRFSPPSRNPKLEINYGDICTCRPMQSRSFCTWAPTTTNLDPVSHFYRNQWPI